jgi:methylthioribulose-1-phosphate dehydratase
MQGAFRLPVGLHDARRPLRRRHGGDHRGRPADGPLRLGALRAGDRPSAETGLHCGIYRRFPGAGAVLHGHSVAVTVLSRAEGDAILLKGFELLKAFPGLPTHDGAIALPVLDNDQDIPRLQRAVESRWDALAEVPPGYLIRGHGIYVWGADIPEAMLRLEALEFMLACELEERRAA